MAAEFDKGIAKGVPTAREHQDGSIVKASIERLGHQRIQGDAIDTSALKEEIFFPFSKKVAKNRIAKAPMTERLCKWPNNHQEDIVMLLLFLFQF
jgi:hypothetical protein